MIYIIHFFGNFYLTFFTDFTDQFEDLYKDFIFGYYTQFISIAFSILTFIGLLFIKNGLGVIIKEGFFNLKSATKFKTGGKLFLISGCLSLIFSIVLTYSSQELILFGVMGQDFLLLVIGFSLYIIADILQNGNQLKQENELTI